MSPLPSPSASLFPAPNLPAVIASSSVVNPSDSEPLHSVILSALSYCLAPLARYPPPALLLLTSSWCLVWPCPLHACSAIVFIVDVVLVSAPDSPLIRPSQILFLPPAPVLPPPPSLGLLRLFSLPRAPLPLALAADIR